MTKLTRYDNFKSLKLDTKPGSPTSHQSTNLHVEMEHFLKLLRKNLTEKRMKEGNIKEF